MKLISSWFKINRTLSVTILTTAIFCGLFGLETFVSAKSAAKAKPAIVAQKLTPAATPQAASQASPDYVVTVSTGASIVPGTADTGLHCFTGCNGAVTLPFAVKFYDQTFAAGSTINVGSNGGIQFSSNVDNEPPVPSQMAILTTSSHPFSPS